MNVLFAGTPEFACPSLRWLIEQPDIHIQAVLTQPDRPAGRGRKLTPSPVKQLAVSAGLEVLSPTSLKSDDIQSELRALRPDLLITAAYGLLLPQAVLDLPKHGCWNLHASLLPRWRGASPIQQAILAGDAETGISLMQMDAGLDTGDVLLMRATDIQPDETAGELQTRLSELAANTLAEGLQALQQNQLIAARPQDDKQSTHAPLIRKADAQIDWSLSAEILAQQIRAYNPWPVSHGALEDEPVRIFSAQALSNRTHEQLPGTILGDASDHHLLVGCGQGVLQIDEIQSPGKRRMASADWLRARASRR